MPALSTKHPVLQEIRYIPISYDNAASDESALRLCLTLFPEWESSEGEIEFVRFKDGITNTLLKAVKKRPHCSEEEIDKEAILLRAYGNGTEILIDRQRELTAHMLLAQHGLAPPLLARFENGLLYEYIQGHVCSPQDLTREPVWRGVARRLAEWHALLPIASAGDAAIIKDNVEISLGSSPPSPVASRDMVRSLTPKKPSPNIWTVMAKWILALPATNSKEVDRKEMLQKELKRTVAELADTPGLGGNGLVFGHCDLLSGNVIIQPPDHLSNPKPGSRPEIVSFIDYEYAAPAPIAFDLANHFSEWGGFQCDYSLLPTRKIRRAFIEEYVVSYAKHTALCENSEQYYVERLAQEVDIFRGIPGLYWGIWALIQASISQIDFDYASYAEVRLKEYWDSRGARQEDGSTPPTGVDGNCTSFRERRWAEE